VLRSDVLCGRERCVLVLSWHSSLRGANVVKTPKDKDHGITFGQLGLIGKGSKTRLTWRPAHVKGAKELEPHGASGSLSVKALKSYRVWDWLQAQWRKANKRADGPSTYLFTKSDKDAVVGALRKEAGNKKIGFHSLRRGGPVHVAAQGGTLAQVTRMGGWRTTATALRYMQNDVGYQERQEEVLSLAVGLGMVDKELGWRTP
jgi:hypothetical protein